MNAAAPDAQPMRLDQRLVALGLAQSRARAQAMIAAGAVRVDGETARKPGRTVPADAVLELTEDPCPWVSRAALKLTAALEAFAVSPKDATVLDLGASTGGFTEVCLHAGARRVYAVDVGRDQLHPSLRGHPRVTELSGLNAKALSRAEIPEPVDWIVADVSFISLTKALPATLALAASTARLIALVKPQFEVGPERVGKGGVVKDPAARDAAENDVRAFLVEAGWRIEGVIDSPIPGGDGNMERLVTAIRP